MPKHEPWTCCGCGEPTSYPNGRDRKCECDRERELQDRIDAAHDWSPTDGMTLARFFASDR